MQVYFTNPNTGAQETMLYQWDQKVPMEVELEGADSVEAVFNAFGMKKGIRRDMAAANGKWRCTVPDEALTYGTDLTIFFTFAAGEDGRRTVDKAHVRVIKQLKPEGYVSDEDPEYVLIKDLAKAVAKEEATSVSEIMCTIPKVDADKILTDVYGTT